MKKRVILIYLIVFLTATFLFSGDYKAEIKKYVAIGDSLTAGYQNGTLYEEFQKYSFPNIIATQLGIEDFEQPLISYPGIPAMVYLGVDESGNFTVLRADGLGSPLNLYLQRPYDNLGVPGATLYTALYPEYEGSNPFYKIVLRQLGNEIEQALSLNPDLITFWLGNNEVLGAAVSGRVIEGVTVFPPDNYAQLLAYALNTIKSGAPEAKVIVMNVPDVTAIPYVNYVKPYKEVSGKKLYFIGPEGIMDDNWKLTLDAIGYLKLGYGIPAEYGGNGLPLPDEVTLSPTEISQLKNYVNTYNEIIKKTAENFGFTLFDANKFLEELTNEGVIIGGVHLTTDYITGGLFSLDGVHPSSIGYAIFANKVIKLINEKFDYNIPLYSLKELLEKGSGVLTNSSANVYRMGVNKER